MNKIHHGNSHIVKAQFEPENFHTAPSMLNHAWRRHACLLYPISYQHIPLSAPYRIEPKLSEALIFITFSQNPIVKNIFRYS
ncbi:hypothetical protein C1H46_002544 [Malus baccata]|uniref:Uncharacterized protein n=1 Tax=Malus baccata TaxID=106549 RepID=A0A540NN03_MALBA|nr:hypothetical protein C1H46_002544 [Malus baccata]